MDTPNIFDSDSVRLQGERSAAVDASAAILQRAMDDGREITGDERAELQSLTARFDLLSADLALVDKVGAMSATAGRKTQPDPMHRQPEPSMGGNPPSGVPVVGRSFSAMFGQAQNTQGWRNPGEFVQALARGVNDHRFVATSVEHTGSAGGYAVPPQLVQAVLDRSLQDEVIRPGATVFAMSTNALTVSGRDTESRASGDVAGLKMVWLGENAEGAVDDPIFRAVNLIAHKAAILSEASVELLADALNFQGQLVEGFAESFRIGIDTACLHGTGAGQPAGILNSPALVTIATDGASADTVTFAMIRAMMSRLLPGSFNNAVWIAHPSVLDQLLILRHEFLAGTSPDAVAGGALVNAFQMVGDNWRLMGRPVLWTECGAELGDVGDLMLIDRRYYAIGMRREAGMETSNAPGWARFAQSFRYYTRLAGQSLLSQAVTPVRGSASLGPFIVLAARAG